jgi:WD40 repeat protein
MRWTIVRPRIVQNHDGLGAEKRVAVGCSKLPIFDLRLLGAIAVALIALAVLANAEPVQERTPLRVARGERGSQLMSFAISPTGSHIATTNTAGGVTLRAAESGWQIERFLDYPGYARTVAYSPDGRSLAAGGTEPGICMWDLNSPGSEPTQTVVIPIQPAKNIVFSPNGQSLAVTTDLDGTILIWDLPAGRARMVLHHPSPVVSIAFSPDGRWLAAGGARGDCSILLWDLQTGSRRTLLEDGHGLATALAFSPHGSLLATASSYDHHVRLWDMKTERVCQVFAGHSRSLNSVAFSPDGSLLARAANDGMVGVWTVATGQRLATLDGQATLLRAVALSPDGRTLVLSSGNDDDFRLWNVAEILPASPRPIYSLSRKGGLEPSL